MGGAVNNGGWSLTYQGFLPGIEPHLQKLLGGQEVVQPHQLLSVLSDHTHQLSLGPLHPTLWPRGQRSATADLS